MRTWALENVISGSPIVFEPFVMGARHAAQFRNWYWELKRKGSLKKGIHLSGVDQFFPAKSDMISDRPESDGGGNFGRLARSGVMEAYVAELFTNKLAGIQLSAWQQFLSIFTENATESDMDSARQRIAKKAASPGSYSNATVCLMEKFREIADLLEPSSTV